tara:strand:- start:249 stop:386 length:138 start_codon:yes stop_codon:yes gene_type:complete
MAMKRGRWNEGIINIEMCTLTIEMYKSEMSNPFKSKNISLPIGWG